MVKVMEFKITYGRIKIDNWGRGADIHRFVLTDHKRNFKRLVEHEYMNMTPPPPIIKLATAMQNKEHFCALGNILKVLPSCFRGKLLCGQDFPYSFFE